MAHEMDPEAVADVFREHDPARAPEARLQSTADGDVERVLQHIKPGPSCPAAEPWSEHNRRDFEGALSLSILA
jgi:hypothetical protein